MVFGRVISHSVSFNIKETLMEWQIVAFWRNKKHRLWNYSKIHETKYPSRASWFRWPRPCYNWIPSGNSTARNLPRLFTNVLVRLYIYVHLLFFAASANEIDEISRVFSPLRSLTLTISTHIPWSFHLHMKWEYFRSASCEQQHELQGKVCDP